MRGHHLLIGALALFAIATGNAQAQEERPAVPLDEVESGLSDGVTEPPNLETGVTGSTSQITGSSMDYPSEGSGHGMSRGDTLFQSPAAASHAGAVYESQPPERPQATLPDDPLGATDSGRREDGEPQASTSDAPNDE